MNVDPCLKLFFIPIRYTDGLQVYLDNTPSKFKCVDSSKLDGDLVSAVMGEITEKKLASYYQSVLINEGARCFNATALTTDCVAVSNTLNTINYYFLGTFNGDTDDGSGQWVYLKDTEGEVKATLQKFNLAETALSFFNKLPTKPSANSPVIAFDCGGILFEWKDERLFKNMGEVFSCSPRLFEKIFLGDWCRYALHTDLKSHYEIFTHVAGKTNPSSFTKYIDAYFKSESLIAENIQTIKELKEKYSDIRFILTSNTNSITEKFLLDSDIIKSCFQCGFFSWRMREVKPNSVFFKRVEHITGSNNVFFVDDSAQNLEVAKNNGWTPYFSDTNGRLSFADMDRAISGWLKNN